MIQNYYYDATKQSLTYKLMDWKNGERVAVVLGGSDFEDVFIIPESIDGYPVKAIQKKAFLGERNLRRVVIPPTIEEIGEWAFHGCKNIKEIYMPRLSVKFGKGVFGIEASLEGIYIYSAMEYDELCTELCEKEADELYLKQKDENIQTARLLSLVTDELLAEYLLDFKEAGSVEWLKKWDGRLLFLLDQPDEEGYQWMILCGEEDLSANLEDYLFARQCYKARLCFWRLLYPVGIAGEFRIRLENYLREHTKGEESEAAFHVLINDFASNSKAFDLFYELDCITDSNYQSIILAMGEKLPEQKASIIAKWNNKKKDFFGNLAW